MLWFSAWDTRARRLEKQGSRRRLFLDLLGVRGWVCARASFGSASNLLARKPEFFPACSRHVGHLRGRLAVFSLGRKSKLLVIRAVLAKTRCCHKCQDLGLSRIHARALDSC